MSTLLRKSSKPIDYVFEECVLLLRANNFGVIVAPDNNWNMVYLEDNQTKKFYLIERSAILNWCEDARVRGRIVYSAYVS